MLRLCCEKEGMLKGEDVPGLIINIRNSLKKLLGNFFFCIAQGQATRLRANKAK